MVHGLSCADLQFFLFGRLWWQNMQKQQNRCRITVPLLVVLWRFIIVLIPGRLQQTVEHWGGSKPLCFSDHLFFIECRPLLQQFGSCLWTKEEAKILSYQSFSVQQPWKHGEDGVWFIRIVNESLSIVEGLLYLLHDNFLVRGVVHQGYGLFTIFFIQLVNSLKQLPLLCWTTLRSAFSFLCTQV